MERILIVPGSEAWVGSDLLRSPLPERDDRRMAAILTQPPVARLARSVARTLRSSGLRAEVRVLPDRDAAKTLEVAADAYEWLTDLGVSRHDTVVAVGGGALTDLAGFVAATYLRGIEVVHIPTTLLGAVDAAIGGKTGVNLRGKNLVGAFWHPTRVVVDLDVLGEAPSSLRRAGLAEALKAGLVGDRRLVELIEEHGETAPLQEVVARAVKVKAEVVAEDFREEGRRAILNYGHTVGHAVEVVGGISHGEAVAVGMVAAGVASARQLGFEEAERVEGIIAGLGLPVRAPGLDGGRVRRLLALDKKRSPEGLRMVLLRDLEDPRVEVVASATVEAALEAIGVS